MKTVDSLKDEVIILNHKNEELTEMSDNLLKQNEGLKAELNLHKGRELIINKDYENKVENVSKIHLEYNEAVKENKNLRRKVTELEAQNIQISKDVKELAMERDSLLNTKNNIEKSQVTKDEENFKIKGQFDNLARQLEKFESQIKVLDAKKKSSEEENEKLNNIIENKSNQIRELEVKSDNYFRQLQDANDNYTTLQSEHKNLSSDFTELLQSKKKLEEKIRHFEKDYNESKYVKEKLADFEESEKTLKNENRTMTRENKALKSELKSLNDIIQEQKSDTELLRQTIKILEDDKKRLVDQLDTNSNDLLQIEENAKHLSNVSSTIEDYKNKISEFNTKILNSKTEIEKLKSDKSIIDFELKKKIIEVSKISENLQRKELEFNTLKMELKTTQEENEKYREEILNKKINEHNNIEITSNLFEIKEALDIEIQAKEKLIFENSNLNEKLQNLNNEKTNLETKISQFTHLLNDADRTRQELLEKFKEEVNKNKINESEANVLKERDRGLDHELNRLREENNRLKQGITQIDHNLDSVNTELDIKTEEISKLNILIINLKEQNEELTNKLSVQLNKGNLDFKRIQERDAELKEIKNLITNLQNENNELSANLNEKLKEVQDLNYDLRCIQSENQTLVEEITNLSKEKEKLLIIKSQLEKNSEFVSQKFRSNEIDLNDIHSSYKEACKENERLKQNLQIFLDENREAAAYIKKVEGQLLHYQNNISSTVLEKDNLIKKIDFLEKYNSDLTAQIAKMKEELIMKGSQENRLRENVKFDREINITYENHIANLNRQIAKLDSEVKTLNETNQNLKTNLDYMNHNKNQSEDDIRNYERIITDERKKVHNLNSAVANLKEEVVNLREENKRIMKLINDNKDMKELKNKILQVTNQDMSMNSSNTGRTPNFIETVSSDDENAILKRFIAELNGQIEDLKREMRNVREENTRLISERSMRENVFSERGMSMNMNNSQSSSSSHHSDN